MKKIYITSISNNLIIDDFFLVVDKKINQTKNDSNYLLLTLQDKTGTIDAKKWNIQDNTYDNINSGDIVVIKGKAEKFKDKIQIIIESIEKVEENDETYLKYLIPQTDKNIPELLNKLEFFKNLVEDSNIKKLLERTIFSDELYDKFQIAPAASGFHHAYRGGLLEHTVTVTEISNKLGEIYKVDDRDILIAGSLLHDIGKIYEYDFKTFKRTDEGRLIGHIVIGINIVSKQIEKIKNFSLPKANAIKHIILSHHGEFEWGSPVQPAFLEAIIVHFADLMDSKIQPIISNISSQDGWIYLRSLKRKMVGLGFFKEDKIKEEDMEKTFKKDTNVIFR